MKKSSIILAVLLVCAFAYGNFRLWPRHLEPRRERNVWSDAREVREVGWGLFEFSKAIDLQIPFIHTNGDSQALAEGHPNFHAGYLEEKIYFGIGYKGVPLHFLDGDGFGEKPLWRPVSGVWPMTYTTCGQGEITTTTGTGTWGVSPIAQETDEINVNTVSVSPARRTSIYPVAPPPRIYDDLITSERDSKFCVNTTKACVIPGYGTGGAGIVWPYVTDHATVVDVDRALTGEPTIISPAIELSSAIPKVTAEKVMVTDRQGRRIAVIKTSVLVRNDTDDTIRTLKVRGCYAVDREQPCEEYFITGRFVPGHSSWSDDLETSRPLVSLTLAKIQTIEKNGQ